MSTSMNDDMQQRFDRACEDVRAAVKACLNGGHMCTVRGQWGLFEALVIPKGSPAIQVREMRNAFYAAAEAMLRINHAIGGMSEEAGMAVLNGLQEECQQYAETWLKESTPAEEVRHAHRPQNRN